MLPQGPPQTISDWVAEHIRAICFLKDNNFEQARAIIENGLKNCPFHECVEYHESALLILELREAKFDKCRNHITKITNPEFHNTKTAVLVQADGESGQYESAKHEFAKRRAFRGTSEAELFQELERRYVTQTGARHDNDWIIARHLDALLAM